jgi:hypothetical protein
MKANDKEKLLLGIIITILSAVLAYRIAFVDHKFDAIDNRIDKVITDKQTNTGAG